MFCKYCGEQISYTGKWCGHCGKEIPPLYMYRKAVLRTNVPKSAAESLRQSPESRDAGPAGDLKSFMANTVAVTEQKSSFDSEGANAGRPAFDGDRTQASVSAFYGEAASHDAAAFDGDATQPGVSAFYGEAASHDAAAFDGDATQPGGSAFYGEAAAHGAAAFDGERTQADGPAYHEDTAKTGSSAGGFFSGSTAGSPNPAASFNRSGDLVGYPGEEDALPGKEKSGKDPVKKSAGKRVRILIGIVLGVLIAGIIGFGLGRIFPRSDRTGTGDGKAAEDVVESAAVTVTPVSEQSSSGEENEQNESGSSVTYDTRSAVSEAVADTAGVEAGTAENIEEKNVNGPNIGGDIPVDTGSVPAEGPVV